MSSSSPIHSEDLKEGERKKEESAESDGMDGKKDSDNGEIRKNNGEIGEVRKNNGNSSSGNNVVVRRERPSRACTQRATQRMQEAAAAEAKMAAAEKKRKAAKRRERLAKKEEVEEEEEGEVEEEVGEEEEGIDEGGEPSSSRGQCSKVVTSLVGEPEASQLPRWNIRSMWQLASILNFMNVFRHLLNIKAEFSVEEFETALISPNSTLGEIHMPILKAIPPITRMALGQNTWITVLCRKLRDWWHWVAEGDLPIVTAQGAEVEAYHTLDPGVRVVILKALCDIRVEQEDIRSYIDDSIKQGFRLSTFRKERLGGDSHGISYWYEDDPIIGHRLCREIRKVEVTRGKGRNIPPIPNSSYQWETVATNLEEFMDVSEKLFTSTNRTEISVGKKLKNNMLEEIEKVHKRKEKLLKKQHRQALLLDNMIQLDGLTAGRSLRDRKPVTYTFDDFDKSINEAIKDTKDNLSFSAKKPPSPDPAGPRDFTRHEVAMNGTCSGPSQFQSSFNRQFSKSSTDDEYGDDTKDETIDRSDRRRKRPQRYSVNDFVEAVSDNDADYDSDDDIVGEAVYDEEYLRQKKRNRSSSSEEDEEYHWDDENPEDEEEEEEANDFSNSDDSDQPRKFMKLPGRTRRGTKLRSVDQIQSGLRRSNRATRNRMDYSYYDLSESENELTEPEKSNGSHEQSEASDDADPSQSEDSDQDTDNPNTRVDQTMEEHPDSPNEERDQDHDQVEGQDHQDQGHDQGEGQIEDYQDHPDLTKKEQDQDQDRDQGQDNRDHPEKPSSPDQNEVEGLRKRQFLDLNELAPGSGYDDLPNCTKDEDTDDY